MMSLSSPPSKQTFIGAVEDHWDLYSDNSADYTLGSPIGFGASSIVYSAIYRQGTKEIPCALKVLDLDSLPPHSLSLLQRETTLMSLSKHPNVLRVRGSWIDGHKLYIALRLMNKGSAADVMAYGWPGGMEEEVVRCILRQALQGLNYLHINGFIHRDVKAANLLCDEDGTVLLGDLGVAADLQEDSSHSGAIKPHHISSASAVAQPQPGFSVSQPSYSRRSTESDHSTRRIVLEKRPGIGKRKSFVGTPCWMAPELIQGKQYDSSADIWSFGITALELSQGRPPRSRESPQSVLLRTIQDAPPTLDREGGNHKYSKAFQEMVQSCLVKDPSKRPTAEQLLATPFFKNSKKKSYLINTILKDLPPAAHRQQRRALPPSHNTRNSVDSWDFANTIHSFHSNNSTVQGPSAFRSHCLGRVLDSDGEAVFEMECDDTMAKEDRDNSLPRTSNELEEPEELSSSASSSSVSAPDSDLANASFDDAVNTTSALKVKRPGALSLSPDLSSSPSSSSLSATSSRSSAKSGIWTKIKSATKLASRSPKK
ncbi:kinase-like protein [Mycena floridula]|nr:kinase-like protein [Mycena floridula]